MKGVAFLSVFAALLGLATIQPARAVPRTLYIQGILQTAAGVPVNGTRSVTFRLYEGEHIPDSIWAETQILPLQNGRFEATLGQSNPIPLPLYTSIYLGITVNPESAEMQPRLAIGAVPFALGIPNVIPTADGNVGIGTIAADYRLDVWADQAVGRFVSSNATNGSVLELRNDTTSAGTLGAVNFTVPRTGGIDYPGQIAYLRPDALAFRVGGAERARLTGDGRLGLGTATPGFPLTFANTLGNKIALYTAADGSSNVGFGVQGNLLQIHSDTPQSDIAFGYGSSANMYENVRFTHDGKVGIGTNAPASALDIRAAQATVSLLSHSTSGSVLELRNDVDTTTPERIGSIKFVTETGNCEGQINCDSDGAFTIGRPSRNEIIISREGMVGIGIWPMHEMLEVDGNVKALNVTVPSDARYKSDIRPLSGALEKVQALNGVTYLWNPATFPEKNLPTGRQVGLIAQEVEKVLPEAVSTDPSGFKSLSYQSLVPVLIEAIKEQQKEIANRDARLAEQQRRIDALALRLDRLERRAASPHMTGYH